MTQKEAVLLWERAYGIAYAHGANTLPRPMVFTTHISGQKPTSDIVTEGMCGFAWVTFYYRNKECREFCKHIMTAQTEHQMTIRDSSMRYHQNQGRDEPACWKVWVGDYNQSMERKSSFAKAFMAIMQMAGIPCTAGERMD